MTSSLSVGFQLDRQWHWLRGEMEKTKKPALLAVCRILNETNTPYAIIGGVALQVHQREPRTTIDIDIALPDRVDLPAAALTAAGFRPTGRFEHSENWVAADGTPVQFTDDPALRDAVSSADELVLDEVKLRVIRAVDLLHEKLRSGCDRERRRSKRLQDMADAQSLLEQHPALERSLRPDERALLDKLPK